MAIFDVQAYRAFCAAHQDSLPIFLNDWFLEAVCHDGEWGAALVYDKNAPIGIWPWFRKRQYGFTYLAMPLFTKFMGPWISPAITDHRKRLRLIQALEDKLPRVDCIKADCHYQLTNWLPLYWKKYKQTTRYSYRLDLSADLDNLFKGINRNMRRNIQSAEQTLEIKDFDDPTLFYHINAMSFERQGIMVPYSSAQFLSHDEALQKHNRRKMFLAEDDQKRIHSVGYLIWDKQAAYYHLSGDDPELRSSGSGILMIWHAIAYAKTKLNVPIFDFEGSMMQSVGDIRRQFGAQPIAYSRIWKYHSTLYAFLDFLRKRS